jgi:hypothetical protein
MEQGFLRHTTREVRNLICTYLANDAKTSAYILVLSEDTKVFCSRACIVANRFGCDSWHHGPQYLQPAVVGSDVVLEIVEAYYKAMLSNPRHPFHAKTPRHVERFVLKDYFSVGVKAQSYFRP